jgi:integrase/recombinase XerD
MASGGAELKIPIFQSSLAPALRGFITLRQSLGYQVRSLIVYLSHFDRYVVATGYDKGWLSRNLVEGWVVSTALLKPGSRAHRLHVMRVPGRYLVQTHPETYVPGPSSRWPQASSFCPHIYTTVEIQSLLNEAARLTPVGSLRPFTFRTLIGLLYCTGLRISEALALRLADVDLNDGVLLIRDSKFRKTRAVPLAADASRALAAYTDARRRFSHRLDGDAPFFVNEWRRACSYPVVNATFLGIARRVGIRSKPGIAGPRIHDLRHTFAVHRLLGWYRDGGDVQARLPLLTTYLGHVCLISTQAYLHITAELLQVAAQRFHAPELSGPAAPAGEQQ